MSEQNETSGLTRSFVTGSRAYGIPRRDSDLDLVVMVSPTTLAALVNHADDATDPEDEAYLAAGTASLRFGKLNLICVTNERMFEAWRDGTRRLRKQKPVPREYAVEYMRRVREEYGFHDPKR